MDRTAREFDRLISTGTTNEDDARAAASYLVDARLLLRRVRRSHGVMSATPTNGNIDELVEYDCMIAGLQGDLEIVREHAESSRTSGSSVKNDPAR